MWCFFSFGESIGRLVCREQERRKGQADDIKVRYLRVLLKRMANDAVAMLNPPRRKRVKEKGWWLRCEVRGEKEKNQAGRLCWQTRDGRVFLWFLLGLGGGGAHKRQARKVCSAGGCG